MSNYLILINESYFKVITNLKNTTDSLWSNQDNWCVTKIHRASVDTRLVVVVCRLLCFTRLSRMMLSKQKQTEQTKPSRRSWFQPLREGEGNERGRIYTWCYRREGGEGWVYICTYIDEQKTYEVTSMQIFHWFVQISAKNLLAN